jgi:hypothetical protein
VSGAERNGFPDELGEQVGRATKRLKELFPPAFLMLMALFERI